MTATGGSGHAAGAPAASDAEVPSRWSPFRVSVFRTLWLASLASNVGTWMHLVAASWLMTSLTASAAVVALIQTAWTIPAFALALPAGALADVVDRRRMIMFTQAWQLAAAAALGAVTLADAATPGLVLGLTATLAAGAALGMPALWAVTPEVVPRRDLAAAVSLNSASFTLAQAIGPAVGGLLVAAAGPGAVFLLNGASFLAVVGAAAAWRRTPPVRSLPPEHVLGAIRTGVRYVVNARPLQVVLVRVAGHVLFFSALPALIVLVTRNRLDAGAGTYGALYACLGVGGAAGAVVLPRLRERIGVDRLVILASVVLGAGLAALAVFRSVAPLFPVMLLAGAASMTILSSLNIAAQSVLPSWVRGRGLAVYLLMFQAGFAVGAALWGAVAQAVGLATAMAVAAGGLVLLHVASLLAGLRLSVADHVDLTPALWSEPQFALQPDPGDGPVLIEIEYRIAAEDTAEFVAAMGELRRSRRRDGAMRWAVFQDLSDPERHVETFLVASWAEHERQHERSLRSDRAAIERVLTLHRGDAGPRVSHLLGHHPRRGARTTRGGA